MIFKELVLRC